MIGANNFQIIYKCKKLSDFTNKGKEENSFEENGTGKGEEESKILTQNSK